jgi:hypothetical protein
MMLSTLLFVTTSIICVVVVVAYSSTTTTTTVSFTTTEDVTDDGQKTNNKQNNDMNDTAIYKELGVPLPTTWTFGGLNRLSWKINGQYLIPLLHSNDNIVVPDSFVNLRVLWCKALSSFNPKSTAGVYEGHVEPKFITYNMLPQPSRNIIKYFWWSFPRWMHANIELRTTYICQSIHTVLDRLHHKEGQQRRRRENHRICMIVLGGGYDTLATKLLYQHFVDRVYELDLSSVVETKQKLLHRAFSSSSLQGEQQERWKAVSSNWNIKEVDLNDITAITTVLDEIQTELQDSDGSTTTKWHTIIVSEALLLYLNPGMAGTILEQLSQRFGGNGGSTGQKKKKRGSPKFDGATFIFADKLPIDNKKTVNKNKDNDDDNSSTTTEDMVRRFLRQHGGWLLQGYKDKPGATRHLGTATTDYLLEVIPPSVPTKK